MPRKNVHLPNDLAAAVREQFPDLNVSAVLQEALRALLDGTCEHHRLTCADCGKGVSRHVVSVEALGAFWRELLWTWEPLVDKGGTAEGAARVGKEVAVRMGVPGAETQPLPRPPRAAREPRR